MEELFTFEGHIRMSVLPSGLWNIGLADEAVIAANPVEGFVSLLKTFQDKGQFPTKRAL